MNTHNFHRRPPPPPELLLSWSTEWSYEGNGPLCVFESA